MGERALGHHADQLARRRRRSGRCRGSRAPSSGRPREPARSGARRGTRSRITSLTRSITWAMKSGLLGAAALQRPGGLGVDLAEADGHVLVLVVEPALELGVADRRGDRVHVRVLVPGDVDAAARFGGRSSCRHCRALRARPRGARHSRRVQRLSGMNRLLAGAACRVVGIDVGGSSIKGYLVDVASGAPVGELQARSRARLGFGRTPCSTRSRGRRRAARTARCRGRGRLPGGRPRRRAAAPTPTSHQYPGWKGLADRARARRTARRGRSRSATTPTSPARPRSASAPPAGRARHRPGADPRDRDRQRPVPRRHASSRTSSSAASTCAGSDGVAEDHCAGRVRAEQRSELGRSGPGGCRTTSPISSGSSHPT